MLFVHEVHRVVGEHERRFEAAYRDELMPRLGEAGGARLLWYLHHAHGTGPAYQVITVTGVEDGAAWETLEERMAPDGDLHDWATLVDSMRHGLSSKILRPVPWSPLEEVDLADVPTDGREHDLALFMEDTAWPYRGGLDAYLDKAGSLYLDTLRQAEEAGRGMLRLEAAFSPAFGTGVHREVVLWQRILRPDALAPLFGTEVPDEYRGPGTWMHDALSVRDQWESRLLRTAPWSPLP